MIQKSVKYFFLKFILSVDNVVFLV